MVEGAASSRKPRPLTPTPTPSPSETILRRAPVALGRRRVLVHGRVDPGVVRGGIGKGRWLGWPRRQPPVTPRQPSPLTRGGGRGLWAGLE